MLRRMESAFLSCNGGATNSRVDIAKKLQFVDLYAFSIIWMHLVCLLVFICGSKPLTNLDIPQLVVQW